MCKGVKKRKNLFLGGNSIDSQFLKYRHELDDFYLFYSGFYSFIIKPSINQYLFRLKRCEKSQSFKPHLFFLSPKKGGFICYHNGFKGFMPADHGLVTFKKYIKLLYNDPDVKRLLSFKNYCIKLKNLKKNFFFRFHFLKIETILRRYGRYRRKFRHKKLKFKRRFKKKKLITKSSIVFLSYIKRINNNQDINTTNTASNETVKVRD